MVVEETDPSQSGDVFSGRKAKMDPQSVLELQVWKANQTTKTKNQENMHQLSQVHITVVQLR